MPKSEAGFTLLETLIVLSIFLLLTSLYPLLLKSIHSSLPTQQSKLELNIFFNQVAHEIKESVHISSSSNSLLLTKGNGDLITLEKTSTGLIRRLKNGTGHVQMLSGVDNFQCNVLENLVECKTELADGSKRTRSMMAMPRLRQEGGVHEQ